MLACCGEKGEEHSSLLAEGCSHLQGLCSRDPAEPRGQETQQWLWSYLGSAGWAVTVVFCIPERGFGLCLVHAAGITGCLTKNAPEGLVWVAFLSALRLAVELVEDAPRSSEMLLVALTSVSWHLSASLSLGWFTCSNMFCSPLYPMGLSRTGGRG